MGKLDRNRSEIIHSPLLRLTRWLRCPAADSKNLMVLLYFVIQMNHAIPAGRVEETFGFFSRLIPAEFDAPRRPQLPYKFQKPVIAQRGPDEAAERPPKGVGMLATPQRFSGQGMIYRNRIVGLNSRPPPPSVKKFQSPPHPPLKNFQPTPARSTDSVTTVNMEK